MKKPSQMSVIAKAFLSGETLNLSKAYKITKAKCKCGCMKLSTRVSDTFEKQGLIFDKKLDKEHYMNYTLNRKLSSKDGLKWLKKTANLV